MRTILLAGALLTGATLAAAPASPGAPTALSSSPIVDDVPPKDVPKKAEVTVWVLEASGKGWSAGKQARAALQKFEDRIDVLRMSGTCATLTLKKDKTITKEELEKELKAKRITLKSFEKETRTKAKAAYVIATSGMTWAGDCGKVRAALQKELGDAVVAVHADKETVIELAKDEELDVDAVEAVLKRLKVKHKGIERDDEYIL